MPNLRPHSTHGLASILPLSLLPSPRNPYFTGREALFELLHQRFKAAPRMAPIQAISGLGGSGKTQVALEYAYRSQQDYHDLLWAAAQTHESLVGSYAEIARRLRLHERDAPDQHMVIEAVKRWLREHNSWLLVLDNLEDLSLLPRFLPVQHQGAVLLTTRRQVTEPMALALVLEGFTEEEGTLFLLRRIRRLEPTETLEAAPAHEVRVARAITEHLGGLPLALDQAGAYILETGCDLATYLNLYHQRQGALLQWQGSVPTPHPASVTTTLTLAFEHVEQKNPAALTFLTLCAFLAPEAIPEALLTESAAHLPTRLQGTVGDPWQFHAALQDLLASSLLGHHTRAKTLTMHRLVPVVLRERLPEGEQRAWAERVICLLNARFPVDRMNVERWAWCDQLVPHALSAFALSDRWHSTLPEVAALLTKTARYLFHRARYAEAETLWRRALSLREQTLGADHALVAESLLELGILCTELVGQLAIR